MSKIVSKDTYIRTRLNEEIKSDFDEACKTVGVVPSEQLRIMIEDFIAANRTAGNAPYNLRIYRPEDYEFGVWRVTVTLAKPSDGQWLGAPISFELPELPNRKINSDLEYRAIVRKAESGQVVLGGRFDDGVWRGHISTNGCEELVNPISIKMVEQALRETFDQTMKKFHGIDAFNYKQLKREEHYKDASVIADWVRYKYLWTKNMKNAGHGEVTPGIYGLNIVEGFCDSFNDDDELYVISRHVSSPKGHIDMHHLYVTRFEDWVHHMRQVEEY